MKKIRTLLAAILVIISINGVAKETKNLVSISRTETNVYICNSGSAVAYHATETCRGIKNCTHEILKVTKTDAVSKYGRRACKVCY